MAGWVKRLLGGSAGPASEAAPPPGPAPAQGQAPTSAQSQRQAQGQAQAQTPIPGSGGAQAEPPASGAAALRRPLLDAGGAVAGFEFAPTALLAKRLAAGGDETAAAAHVLALLAGMAEASPGAPTRIALLGLPASLLSRPAVIEALPAGAWLVLPSHGFSAELAGTLQPRQVLVGIEQVPRRGAGFVRINAAMLGESAVPGVAIAACRAAAPTARIVVTGLANAEDVEAALAAGADLAGGHLDVLKNAPAKVQLPPAMLTVARLMQQLQGDSDLTVLARSLRADVALSYALLRHANGPLLGLRRQVDSVEQAIMLLGRAPLFRWLCIRMLAAAPQRRVARALMEVALSRAILSEALAGRAGLEPARAYTVGVFSLLDVMVPMPMAAAVAPLNMATDMQAALIERRGPLAVPVQLAICLERGDAAGAAALAGPFGGLDAVLAAHAEAWSKAAAMTAAASA